MDQQRHRHDTTRAVNIREHHIELGLLKDGWIDRRLRRNRKIGVVRRTAQRDHARQIFFEKRAQFRDRHGVDLRHRRLVVWRHHLRAILKVGLEAVIVGRIVAGRNNNTGMSPEITNRKAQLRCRTRTVKNICRAPKTRPSGSSKLTKMP